MAGRTLQSTFRRLRRRILCIEGCSGLLWGTIAFLAVLLAAIWIDLVLDLSPQLRIGAWVVSGVALVGLLAMVFVRAVRILSDALLANRLDSAGETGGQIRSGSDLSLSGNRASSYSSRPDLTSGLAGLAVDRAAELAANVPAGRAAPARPLLRSLLLLGSLAVVIGALVALMPQIAFTQWTRFVDPFGDHPAYSPYTFHVEPEGAEVLYGGSLELTATVDGPAVDQLELVLIPPDAVSGHSAQSAEPLDVVPMFSEPGGGWRASIANITEEMDYFVRVGRARSQAFPIDVITVPQIEEVRFRITPPAYTGLPEYKGLLPREGLAGLPGTLVEVTARSNRALSGGTLNIIAGDAEELLPLTALPGDEQVAVGTFEIHASGRLDLRVTDVDGQDSQSVFSAPILLLPDERPFVRLTQPREVSFATPTALLPVVISAEDDYGLFRCQLFRSLNDSRYMPLQIDVPTPAPRRLYNTTTLPLAEYGVQPGDEIKLFARVEDNDPQAATEGVGGKGAESSIAVVRIISQEDFERMQRSRDGMQMLMSKYQQAQRRLESLAEEVSELQEALENAPDGSPLEEGLRQQMEELAERLQQEAEALNRLAESQLPYDLDKQLNPQLRELAEMLEQLARQNQQMASNPQTTPQEAREQLQQMQNQLQQARNQQQQNAMQPLELLSQILPLKQAESRFVQLYQRQRDLAERLASLDGRDGEDDPEFKARMRELEEEQQQLRNELRELLDDIEAHAAQLPDDPLLDQLRQTAQEFAEAVRHCGASEAMMDAETGLAEFSGTRGHAGAKEAADLLEKFISQCHGMGGQCQNCTGPPKFSPSLSQCLSQTMQQMLANMGFGTGSKPGNGMGQAAGGGYSAARSGMQNVGMYGGLPLMDQPGMQGGMDDASQPAAGRAAQYTEFGEQDAGRYGARQPGQSGGAGEAVVPLRYQRRVGRYFQRLADEIGDE